MELTTIKEVLHMRKTIFCEITTTSGPHKYEVVGSTDGDTVNLGSHWLTNQPVRFNKKENRVEFLAHDEVWDVLISDSEIIQVDFID